MKSKAQKLMPKEVTHPKGMLATIASVQSAVAAESFAWKKRKEGKWLDESTHTWLNMEGRHLHDKRNVG